MVSICDKDIDVRRKYQGYCYIKTFSTADCYYIKTFSFEY